MEAPVSQLLRAAALMREQYGWLSESLIERRLRVPEALAKWLLTELT